MYELHLTNFGMAPVSLSRIEVLDADAEAGQPIVRRAASFKSLYQKRPPQILRLLISHLRSLLIRH
jgi:hypothetical protein